VLGLSVIFLIVAIVKFRSIKTHREDAELIRVGRADLRSKSDLDNNQYAYHKSLRAVKSSKLWGSYWLLLALLPPLFWALYRFGVLS